MLYCNPGKSCDLFVQLCTDWKLVVFFLFVVGVVFFLYLFCFVSGTGEGGGQDFFLLFFFDVIFFFQVQIQSWPPVMSLKKNIFFFFFFSSRCQLR